MQTPHSLLSLLASVRLHETLAEGHKILPETKDSATHNSKMIWRYVIHVPQANDLSARPWLVDPHPALHPQG